MFLDTYGRSSGFALDPIEKKPLNHFLPGSSVLSFGTAGCNLNCRFCQNWDISKAREDDRLTSTASPEKIAQMAKHLEAASVAFTYNDPVIFAEYAIDTAKVCREVGIRSVAVTAGYISPEARRDFFAVMDGANIDLKAFNEEFYWHQTGAHLRNVLDTIAYVCNETDCWVELTTLLIPGLNDSPEEIARESAWIVREIGPNVPLHFSAFHPAWKMSDVGRTPPQTLTQARQIAQVAGINYVYTGNVYDPEGSATWCPGCGEALIRREWFDVQDNLLERNRENPGSCPRCATPIPGVW